MKNIAVITGVSSGMGRRFAQPALEYESFDELWVIARREDRLLELKDSLSVPVKAIALDLSDPASYARYAALLEAEKPQVSLLVNASGYGKFRSVMDTKLETNLNMVDVNCKALMALCQITVPWRPFSPFRISMFMPHRRRSCSPTAAL